MSRKAAKRWLVEGSVQGVGFRYFVQERAKRMGLCGWVRNLGDGRVEVYAAGPEKKLSELAAALHAGPPLSDVRSVEESEAEVQKISSFIVR